MKKYDYLIVGAGLFGATFAYEMTKEGKTCLVIDRREHIAGNIYCEKINNINVHKYGAHIFHTDSKSTWEYINQFCDFNNYINSPIANYKNEVYNMGNVMRNLIFSDYLVFPNEYMKEKMVSAYMLQNLCKATILNEGYPRNSVFFNDSRRSELRKSFNADDKEIIVYMPTWRGQVNKYDVDTVLNETTEFLAEMDKRLNDNQLMYVKYHPLMKLEFDDNEYRHIKAFPTGFEYYEILNMADTLITDYSSVFYDFANSRIKIILYTYDKEEYFENRGVYVSLDEFPFPQANTIDELAAAINTPKNYDDTEFIKKYCTYDNPDAVKKICERVFLDKPVTNEEKLIPNGKDNVLIFAGNLAKNGITTALLSVLNNIDLSKNNYYLSFRERLIKEDPMRTEVIPENVGVILLIKTS